MTLLPWVFFFSSPLFPPSPLLHRSCCISCPFSPRKRIFTSSSNIFRAQKVWQMKKEPTPCPLSGSAHAVSGNFPILYADAAYRLSLLHKHFCHTSLGRLFWKGGTEIPPTGFSLVDLITVVLLKAYYTNCTFYIPLYINSLDTL